MPEVLSFRPSPEEARTIERVRKQRGLRSPAAAVRFLLREGAKKEKPLSEDPVWKFRLPKKYRARLPKSSREIDDFLYGGRP